MATNDFKPFAIGSGANVTAQADWEALAALVTGFQSGVAKSAQVNKALRQGSVMAYLLGQFIADQAEVDAADDGDTATLLTNFVAALKAANESAGFLNKSNNLSDVASVSESLANLGLGTGLTGVVGQSRNAVMNVTAASSTATWTADELIVETALGGTQYRLNNLNLSVNLATSGAGGMDTGTVPTTGFVALYVIYNPTTQASALLAVNATSTTPGEVYGGSDLPSGYTASALVSVWRVASGQFVIGYLQGRTFTEVSNAVATYSSPATSITALSLATYVPRNAKRAILSARVASQSGTGGIGAAFATTSTGIGKSGNGFYTGVTGISFDSIPTELPIATMQTAYYYTTPSGSVSTYSLIIYCTGYVF